MANALPESFNITIWVWIVSIIVPAIAGLSGVLIGAWRSGRQQEEQRKLAFIEKQLRYFYSPLLGIRKEIQMLSELQNKISKSADANWRKMCKEARKIGGVEYLGEETNARKDEFMGVINYNNKQLTESLLPSYRRMVTIFREYYYLAEPDTCKHFCHLLEFVDIWNRWLDRSIPPEVLEDLDYRESVLQPLYDEIEKIHNEHRVKLVNGKT